MRDRRLFQPMEKMILVYLTGVLAFILTFRRLIPGWPLLLAAQAAALLALVLFVRAQERFPSSTILRVSRDWLPLPFIFFSYRMIHFLINPVRNPGLLSDRDGLLIAADRFLFGGDPTRWLERFAHPWLTEVMQLFYSTNYFLPLALLLILYLGSRRVPFRHAVFLLTLAYFLSFIGYFLFPAIGPRFTLEHARPLEGLWLRDRLADWVYFMESHPRDCFPSGHTAIPLVTLWLARRFNRLLFRIYLPIVAGLIISTVYLRYHYVVDVIAGIALAGFAVSLERLNPEYRTLRDKAFLF